MTAEGDKYMANRISLNPVSYHGAGAIAEIVNEMKAHGFQKAFVAAITRLGRVRVKTGRNGNIRRDCAILN